MGVGMGVEWAREARRSQHPNQRPTLALVVATGGAMAAAVLLRHLASTSQAARKQLAAPRSTSQHLQAPRKRAPRKHLASPRKAKVSLWKHFI